MRGTIPTRTGGSAAHKRPLTPVDVAGKSAGERKERSSMQILITKKADDLSLGEKVLRISIGGNAEEAYITYRGDLAEVQALLKQVARRFSLLAEDLEVSPDDGKKFA